MISSQLTDILALVNDVLQAIIVIFGSAVILFYSNRIRRSPVTRAFILLIGGAFGQYINIEKAVQIGLLPDAPWENFQYLGNTSVRGAYLALLSREAREQVANLANRMTYLELSADNSFFEEFNAALFLPHTDEAQFPTVMKELKGSK